MNTEEVSRIEKKLDDGLSSLHTLFLNHVTDEMDTLHDLNNNVIKLIERSSHLETVPDRLSKTETEVAVLNERSKTPASETAKTAGIAGVLLALVEGLKFWSNN